jgi:hypothetical protein
MTLIVLLREVVSLDLLKVIVEIPRDVKKVKLQEKQELLEKIVETIDLSINLKY